MTESVDRQTAVLRLRGADDILILCHKNPDGDTIGCAGALYLRSRRWAKTPRFYAATPSPKCMIIWSCAGLTAALTLHLWWRWMLPASSFWRK